MRRALRPLFSALLLGAAAAGATLLPSAPASAKAAYDSSYGYDRTWNAALRLVRVDNGFKINEKDAESGYILFEYRSAEAGSRTSSGSIELVRGREADEPVKVVVQLSQMPQYHEQMLADQLARKMRQEYGDPPPRRKGTPSPPPVAPDGGAPDAA